ncbi:hypothetical protein BM1_04764 [Bipolaris maydis]|nr:hypothetical protein BM1_04764 [Bipolaris maydis]
MNILLDLVDPLVFDSMYGTISHVCNSILEPSNWERSGLFRQSTSIFFLILITTIFFYFAFGSLCHGLHFQPALHRKPKWDKEQIKFEIYSSLLVIVNLSLATVPIFLAQIHGYARIYPYMTTTVWYEIAQYPLFFLFSETAMYWLHRMFHAPFLFERTHKDHHRFTSPTAFSAYAFHPIEAFAMSLPVYAYSFLLPMSDVAQLVVFIASNIGPFLLHDNSVPFHLVHHKNTNFNYGQFLPHWDILCGTYREPNTILKAKHVDQ